MINMPDNTPNISEVMSGIIGFWSNVGGDYALTNEYRADGTVVQHVGKGSSSPQPFRIDGDCLIFSIVQPNGSIFEQRARFVLSGDLLTLLHSPKTKCVFKRSSGPN